MGRKEDSKREVERNMWREVARDRDLKQERRLNRRGEVRGEKGVDGIEGGKVDSKE